MMLTWQIRQRGLAADERGARDAGGALGGCCCGAQSGADGGVAEEGGRHDCCFDAAICQGGVGVWSSLEEDSKRLNGLLEGSKL